MLGVPPGSFPEATSYELDIALRCYAATSRLLLEYVEDIDGLAEADRIDCPVRTTVIVLDDLEDTGVPESRERLG